LPAFYTDQLSSILRFGDVVTGFQLTALRVDSPGASASQLDLKIHVTRPPYFAVMTPCCSIEMQSISLAPLTEVRHSFFSVPRFEEDLTRINVPMLADQAIPPKRWESMSPGEKSELLAKGPSYVFYECFVYEPHDVFRTYELKKGKLAWNVKHRMVDFKTIFRVECVHIDRNRDAPSGIKLLQMTTAARAQLRDKLTYYFGRNADEEDA